MSHDPLEAILARVFEETLTDGSKAYDVLLGDLRLACPSEADAETLCDLIEKHTLNVTHG